MAPRIVSSRAVFSVAHRCDYTVWIVNASKTAQKRTRPRSTRRASPASPIVAPWRLHKAGGLEVLQLDPFRKLPWLVHGFSTRSGGVSELAGEKVLNLSFTEWDARENVEENRRRLQRSLSADAFTLVALKQIHSDAIHIFRTAPRHACSGDASATNQAGLLLAVQTADCVPILLVDPKQRAVAAIHAGWRGTLGRITQKTVGRMQLEFASLPQDLLAAIGPSIGPCCYEVGADFVPKFTAQFADASEYFDEAHSGEEPNPLQWLNMAPPGHQPPPKPVHLDLRKANRSQLLAAGLRTQNIFESNLCTGCRTDLFFSYRKGGTDSGRLLSVVGIRGRAQRNAKGYMKRLHHVDAGPF
jgi:polyphenol oxidase